MYFAMEIAPQTQLALESHFPHDLAFIIHSCLLPVEINPFTVGYVGHGELCTYFQNVNRVLFGACEGGNEELVKMMIDCGVNDFSIGLYSACKRGYRDIAMLMITSGVADVDLGLVTACTYGQLDMTILMIAHGATNKNDAFSIAHEQRQYAIMGLLIDHGATKCYFCRENGWTGDVNNWRKLLEEKGVRCTPPQNNRNSLREIKNDNEDRLTTSSINKFTRRGLDSSNLIIMVTVVFVVLVGWNI
jgi:hypothetical protein